jgi:predicted unusual protein kinase regulating ubiquinone biosynthesis (AarF/ABC1/UbiB family)
MVTFVSQLLYDGGIVHGDPHAGNIGIDSRGRLVLYDFGSAIRIDPTYRSKLKLVIISLISSDAPDTVRALKNLGIKINDTKLAEAYMSLYYKYVRTIDVNVFRPEAGAEPVMTMPFEFDDTLLRLFRVFGMLEGICKELNDDFDYFEILSIFWDAFILDAEFVRAKGDWDLGVQSSEPPAA